MMLEYKAIIFDWDGTLVDSTDWVVSAHNHVRTTFGLPIWTKDDIFSSSSLSTRELYPQIYGEKAEEAMKLLFDYVDEHNLAGANPYKNALELLNTVKESGFLQAVVSNKKHEPLIEMVRYLKWDRYFSAIVGAGHCERDKPSAKPLLMALSLMEGNLTPKDILYVGDTETDLLCAQNAGCDAAFIQSDKPRPDLIDQYAPRYACNNISEFITFIKGLRSSVNKAC